MEKVDRRKRTTRREKSSPRYLWLAKRLTGLLLAAALLFWAVRLASGVFEETDAGLSSMGAQPPLSAAQRAGGLADPVPAAASLETVRARLDSLRERFPPGSYWNHRGLAEGEWSWKTVTDTPCEHSSLGEEVCNSYDGPTGDLFPQYEHPCQCLGFASMLSDEIFGAEAPVFIHRSYDRLREGDQIRLTGEEHSMVVVDKQDDGVRVAECNADYETCRIDWNREISREELEAYGEELEYITRRES